MIQHITRLLLAIMGVAVFALPIAAGAGAVTSAGKAEDVGLSGERLGRVREAVKRHIDAGSLPGAVQADHGGGRDDAGRGRQDPKEKMVTIIMMQVSTPALQRDFDNAVMQAIID
jgi:hypothetical protein